MMRKLFSVALMATLACLMGFSQDAKAGATIELIWRCPNEPTAVGCGTSTLDFSSGALSSTVTLDIFLTMDETLSAVSISLQYDADGANELDFVSATGWGGTNIPGMGTTWIPVGGGATLVTESGSGGPTGNIKGYASLSNTAGAGLAPGTFNIGTAVFHLTGNSIPADGFDILSGLFDTGVDGLGNVSGGLINSFTQFGDATVNHVPEPGTAALLGLGLVGLVLSGRRRRS